MVDSAKMLTRQRMLHWAQFIRDCKASGLSVRAFCEDAGVKENVYYYWQKKLKDEACGLLMMGQMSNDAPEGFAQQGFAAVVVAEEPAHVVTHESASASRVVRKDTGLAPLFCDAPSVPPALPAPLLPSAPKVPKQSVGQIQIEGKRQTQPSPQHLQIMI